MIKMFNTKTIIIHSMCIVVFSTFLVHSFELFSRNVDIDKSKTKNCTCVPVYLCQDEDNPVLDGSGMLDVRSFDTTYCENYYYICCNNPKRNVTGTKQEIRKCGYKNSLPLVERITTNSEETHFAELPWTVVILFRDDVAIDRPLYKCGGSLIHPQVVLTAAHCIKNLDNARLVVRAGEWNTRNVDEPLYHQDLGVEEVVLHPMFNENSLKNDIVLLFLTEEFVMLDNVGIICLPPQGFKRENARCLASGWGKDAFKKGRHSAVLKKITLPLVSRANCQSLLRNTRLGPFYTLHQSFICAGGEHNKDTCQGDGGSPLICTTKRSNEDQGRRYYQIGIVSWGIGCGRSKTPGVYVNVPLFIDWIDRQMKLRNFDIEIYKY